MTAKMSFEAAFDNLPPEAVPFCAEVALRMWERSEDMSCYRGPNNASNPWAQMHDADMARGCTPLAGGGEVVGYWDQWDGTSHDPIRA